MGIGMSEKTSNDSGNLKIEFGYASVELSAVAKDNWAKTDAFLKEVFANRGVDADLIVKLFGKDEIWVVFEYTNLDDIEKVEEESFITYTATLTRHLPLNLKVIEDISKEEQVVYLLFRKRQIK